MRNYITVWIAKQQWSIWDTSTNMLSSGPYWTVGIGREEGEPNDQIETYLRSVTQQLTPPLVLQLNDASSREVWMELSRDNVVALLINVANSFVSSLFEDDFENFLQGTYPNQTFQEEVTLFVDKSPRSTWSHGK